MRFSGQVVLVVGATGNIGSGAVLSFLRQGARVIAPSRSANSLKSLNNFLLKKLKEENLENLLENLDVQETDVSNPSGVQRLKEHVLSRHGKLDHVVCSSGPWWNTPPLHSLDYETFKKATSASIDAHFLVWSSFGSLILPQVNSSFTFVNGAAALNPGVGLTSYLAQALHSLISVVFAQTSSSASRINELMLDLRVEDDETYEKMGKPSQSTCSSSFGDVFTSLASDKAKDIRGRTINLNTFQQLEEWKNGDFHIL
eukprot:TRINITY_DN3859_c0_g2_i2.p1 TRINITY_DN3859_c0_g2~~TRINITY_DN3859_c0_g2_i2.p1  ORF type:complete len:257 (+),score=38.65 TRINITY_DN3859_c0_g2_i2:583-1353(+)